jgi:hypothetical protein
MRAGVTCCLASMDLVHNFQSDDTSTEAEESAPVRKMRQCAMAAVGEANDCIEMHRAIIIWGSSVRGIHTEESRHSLQPVSVL